MFHIFVDFEMNVIDKAYREQRMICKREIIEIGAVKLDENCEVIDTFSYIIRSQNQSIRFQGWLYQS